MPTTASHFQLQEFACPHCHVALVRPKLLEVLERIRAVTGKPLPIVSGYRCPVHNKAVGGAANSQHMYAAAADIPAGHIDLAGAYAAGATGVGTKDSHAVHVDVRDGARTHWVY